MELCCSAVCVSQKSTAFDALFSILVILLTAEDSLRLPRQLAPTGL